MKAFLKRSFYYWWLIFIFCLFLFPQPILADNWWNTDWKYRTKITFNNSLLSENLTDFPVMVKLNSSRIPYSQVQSSGQDIRFVDSDNQTQLPYEIENWNTGGDSFIWVKIPQVDKNSRDDFIWMYWGNQDSGDEQNSETVWDTSFKMVQHLNEASGTQYDSTSNNNDSSTKVLTEQGTNGKIAGADKFNGSNDYVLVGGINSLDPNANSFTYEGWFKSASTAEQMIFSFNGGNGCRSQGHVDISLSSGNFRSFFITKVSGSWSAGNALSDGLVNDNQWHYGVGRYNAVSGKVELFIDGVQQQTPLDVSNWWLAPSNQTIVKAAIGNEQYGACGANQAYFAGMIDEVRVSGIARSSNWISAQYSSMNDFFLSFNNSYTTALDNNEDSVFGYYKYESNKMPSFTFKKANEGNAFEIDFYQLFIDDNLFIDFIPSKPADINKDNFVNEDEKDFQDDDKYAYYTNDCITVRSKIREIPDGPHTWFVRTTNQAGNSFDSKEKYTLVNSHQSNFSDQFFPLVLSGMTNVGNNLNFNWLNADYSQTKTFELSALNLKPSAISIIKPLFSLWGIAPFNVTSPTHIRATIKNSLNNETMKQLNNDAFVFQQTTQSSDSSIWGINIDRLLNPGDYLLTLESANAIGDYIQLPEVKLVIK